MPHYCRFLRCAALATLLALCAAASLTAQNSSLARRGMTRDNYRQPLVRDNFRWYDPPPIPIREIQQNDIVSIRVDVTARMLSEGEVQRRKNATYDAVLLDWLRLAGITTVKPAPQNDGDPRIQGQLNRLYRSQGDVETRESLIFNIAAVVVGIRPNGNLVLEARRHVRNNEEIWEYSLSGECSKNAVGPGNVVLSRDIAHLRIYKRERGQGPDGYRRGWLTRLLDLFNPF